ncbi:MAG: class I SAM-dependent methyltransferase [Gammaproteobacteria bacterium]|nr:class I SAM-dependent methyltransferase [Gammaproteobacteria bacterium]
MNINWKLKSRIFSIIDIFDLQSFLYFIQKYVTKRSRVIIKNIDKNWIIHKNNISSLKSPSLIEFGAGKSLMQNIYIHQFCRSQTVVDLFPMLDIKQFNEAAYQISKIDPNLPYLKCYNKEDINKNYLLNYIAPFDMENTKWCDNSFDCCVSTNTLEHIPEDSIRAILSEIFRVVKNDGIISMIIDYSDHYAHTDKNIGLLNFLSYSKSEWRRYNHKSHFQNRLRHNDYKNIFSELGFVIEVDKPMFDEEMPFNISKDFNASDPTVHATAGNFLLRVNKK